MTTIGELVATGFWLELERVLECVQHRASASVGRMEEPALRPSRNGSLQSFGPRQQPDIAGAASDNPSEQLRAIFDLSSFELDTLLLCAGLAIDPRFQIACGAATSQVHAASATFNLAMSLLDEPHWSAIGGQRPLRYWKLLEVGTGTLLHAPLHIDERILQFLLGVPALDERLEPLMHPLLTDETSAVLGEPSTRIVAHWRNKTRSPLLITGAGADERAALFCVACRQAGERPFRFDAADLPAGAAERESLARCITRESALCPTAVLVQSARLENPLLLESWLKQLNAPYAIEIEPGSPAERILGTRIDAPTTTHEERRSLWVRHLGPLAPQLESRLDELVNVFALAPSDIRDAAAAVVEEASLGIADEPPADCAWRLCRASARRSMDDLAVHTNSLASWDDLVLPAPQLEVLRQIVANARQASVVLHDWGFSSQYSRGLGLTALFAGPSGTGKTMAAGILARELSRDLYQIDLATVTSKYIGETEKHLRRIFDTAERSGAVLLFDEADALFGKRSQVRDSHDRYANLEISYLLQRMESYRGIAILTTNMHNTLDPAFQRRLRFVVQFPFPDAPSRERIWRRVFPAAAPTANLDFMRLAQLSVTGGVIRNIALLAAFLAADQQSAISMRHVAAAARTEYAKLDKPLPAAETRGWE